MNAEHKRLFDQCKSTSLDVWAIHFADDQMQPFVTVVRPPTIARLQFEIAKEYKIVTNFAIAIQGKIVELKDKLVFHKCHGEERRIYGVQLIGSSEYALFHAATQPSRLVFYQSLSEIRFAHTDDWREVIEINFDSNDPNPQPMVAFCKPSKMQVIYFSSLYDKNHPALRDTRLRFAVDPTWRVIRL